MLNANSLCFTYCQVPVVYQISDKNGLEVVFNNSKKVVFDSLSLDASISKSIFERQAEVNQIIVSIKK